MPDGNGALERGKKAAAARTQNGRSLAVADRGYPRGVRADIRDRRPRLSRNGVCTGVCTTRPNLSPVSTSEHDAERPANRPIQATNPPIKRVCDSSSGYSFKALTGFEHPC